MSILEQIIDKARAAASGEYGVLSRGEKLAAALVLNRTDWLEEEGFTITEALDRLGPQWVAQLPAAAKQLAKEIQVVSEQLEKASQKAKEESFFSTVDLSLAASLVTYGDSPGYRDVRFYFDVEPLYGQGSKPRTRLEMKIRAEDAEQIVRHLRDVHSFAWRDGRRPIDAKDGEVRPSWLDRV